MSNESKSKVDYGWWGLVTLSTISIGYVCLMHMTLFMTLTGVFIGVTKGHEYRVARRRAGKYDR